MVLGQYGAVLGQYNLVLLGIKWNWVSTRFFMPVYIKKSGVLSNVAIAGRTTNDREKIEQPMDHGRLR